MKNKMNKTRDINEPYEIWVNEQAGWEWRVLKKYQRPDLEAKNQYARWFTAVKSPFLYGSYEMGDTYVSDIVKYGVQLSEDSMKEHLAQNPW